MSSLGSFGEFGLGLSPLEEGNTFSPTLPQPDGRPPDLGGSLQLNAPLIPPVVAPLSSESGDLLVLQAQTFAPTFQTQLSWNPVFQMNDRHYSG
jgi:hypothetical protein